MSIQRKLNTHKPKFDLNTHVRDGKGNIVKNNAYKLTIVNGVKEFERYSHPGFIYDEAGTLIRQPKAGEIKPVEQVEEFTNDSLLKQIDALKAQLALKEEVNMKVQDIAVDDVPMVAASEVDNSEEIALMEKAGAMAEAAKVKAVSKPVFQKQNFTK